LKVGEIFLQIFGFFQAPQYSGDEHSHIICFVNGIFFDNLNHPQPLKNDVIVGDTFGIHFKVQMI